MHSLVENDISSSLLFEATSACDVQVRSTAKCHQTYTSRERCPPRSCSDYVFEAVGGITGQRHAFAATAQVLAVRSLHVNVPLLLLAAAASLRATLR